MKRDPLPKPDPYFVYEARKARWIADHPEATSREYEQAMRELAKECGV